MRKLAHIRSLGYGLRMWDSPRYYTPGLSLSHSIYDRETVSGDEQVHERVRQGVFTMQQRMPITDPTMNRSPRIGAQFSSLAQMGSWQSGWQTNWDHLYSRPNLSETRTLTQNNTRNAKGRAEGQRATVYNPWPSSGALYPKAI